MKNHGLMMLLIIIITVKFISAQAPDTIWTRTYESGVGNCVIETSDSCYVIVGSKEDTLGNSDLRLIKVNGLGDSLWSKTLGESGYDIGNSVRQTPDDGFIILGSTSSYGTGKEDIWLIKTDANGNTLWTKTFGGDSSDVGNSIQFTNDGGYIIVGTTTSYGAGGEDAWLIKTDSNGIVEWTKTFGDTADDQGYCIQKTTTDAGYVIGGGSESYGGIWLIKTDHNGDTSWTKTYTIRGIVDGYVKSVVEINDGYIFAGRVGQGGMIIKTNFSGDTLWSKLEGSFFGHAYGRTLQCVIETFNDIYLFAKSGYHLCCAPPYYAQSTSEGSILAFDKTGNKIWADTLVGPSQPRCGIYSIIQAKDSSYVISGANSSRLFIAKLGYSITGIKQSTEKITDLFSLYQNYPNPFNPTTNIKFSIPQNEFVTLKIYNLLGQEVATLLSEKLAAGTYTYTWDASDIASGIYFYSIETPKFRRVKKMIVLQ
jgi:hypothetical protein